MKKLYHATFNAYKDSIIQNGLKLPKGHSNFQDGYIGELIFLAQDFDQAYEFAEVAMDEETISDDIYNSGICVFEVNLPDTFPLYIDDNNDIDDEDYITFCTNKPIPPQYLTLIYSD